MTDEIRRIPANVCSYVDEVTQSLNLEVLLPGVERKDIKLKMVDDSFSLTARRDNIEYVSVSMFCCPVRSYEAKAVYHDGLLRIQVPFRSSMEEAREVEIE